MPPKKPPEDEKPTSEVDAFFASLDRADARIEAGEQPRDRIEKLVYYNKFLAPAGVPFSNVSGKLDEPLPNRPAMLKGGVTHFEFTAPRVSYRVNKGTKDRIRKLSDDTIELTEPSRLAADLAKAGIKAEPTHEGMLKAAAELQMRLDKGEDVGALLHRVHLAAPLIREPQLASDIRSGDPETALNGLHNLHVDRLNDSQNRSLSDPKRVAALREHYARELGLAVGDLPKDALEAKKAMTSGALNLLNKSAEYMRARKAAGPGGAAALEKKWRSKAVAFLNSFSPEYELFNRSSASFRKRAHGLTTSVGKEKGAPATVRVELEPSFSDHFFGYTGGDCTKGREDRMLKEGAVPARLMERYGGEVRHVGNAVLAVGGLEGRPVVHIDVFQPYRSEVEPHTLIKKFVDSLDAHLDPKFTAITANKNREYFSNHPTTKNGYDKYLAGLPQRREVSVTGLPASTHSPNAGHIILKHRV